MSRPPSRSGQKARERLVPGGADDQRAAFSGAADRGENTGRAPAPQPARGEWAGKAQPTLVESSRRCAERAERAWCLARRWGRSCWPAGALKLRSALPVRAVAPSAERRRWHWGVSTPQDSSLALPKVCGGGAIPTWDLAGRGVSWPCRGFVSASAFESLLGTFVFRGVGKSDFSSGRNT